ncbi:MaoC/PaaZ C-terminal domain-containing protein [Hydrogenibacillus sp. N12]|uniref:MaoC/PaaZ C-terminal domain-containing protein n=1 Tax=Hydrogenibacillus sp. N12 TaxID=2866627 RepID=UPI001C7DBEDE|nr:MaoC/PaaZ C-terminal domain-containing protein [Hydrogenibacillus sp. N12]QZA32692.1 MaoC family dehydratase N-terminal domain-containing protein [Hydrogenibacillus sp. N12]
MRFDRPFERYVVGERHRSRGRTVTEADIVAFAGVSGDFFPLHVDETYARRTRFGRRIAHGMLTLSLATGLYTLSPEWVIAFYGLDRVRFVRPVGIGETIAVESEVAGLLDRDPASGIVVVDQTIVNARGEALVSGRIRMLVRKESASTGERE